MEFGMDLLLVLLLAWLHDAIEQNWIELNADIISCFSTGFTYNNLSQELFSPDLLLSAFPSWSKVPRKFGHASSVVRTSQVLVDGTTQVQ